MRNASHLPSAGADCYCEDDCEADLGDYEDWGDVFRNKGPVAG